MQADSDTESDSGEENSAVPTERSTGASQLFYTTSTKGFDYSIPAAIQIIHQSGYNDLAHVSTSSEGAKLTLTVKRTQMCETKSLRRRMLLSSFCRWP